jgi:hypothetical protein
MECTLTLRATFHLLLLLGVKDFDKQSLAVSSQGSVAGGYTQLRLWEEIGVEECL